MGSNMNVTMVWAWMLWSSCGECSWSALEHSFGVLLKMVLECSWGVLDLILEMFVECSRHALSIWSTSASSIHDTSTLAFGTLSVPRKPSDTHSLSARGPPGSALSQRKATLSVAWFGHSLSARGALAQCSPCCSSTLSAPGQQTLKNPAGSRPGPHGTHRCCLVIAPPVAFGSDRTNGVAERAGFKVGGVEILPFLKFRTFKP